MRVAGAALALLLIVAVARMINGSRPCWHCCDPYGWVIERRG